MKRSPLLKASALLSLVLWVAPVRAQQQAQPPLITVTGQAEIRVQPDEVVFNLEVSKLDKDLTVAQRQNDESVRQILTLARRYNVPAEDVKTDYVSVEMRFSTDYVDDDEDSSGAKPKRVKRGLEDGQCPLHRPQELRAVLLRSAEGGRQQGRGRRVPHDAD
jgi:hypothetical protein